MMWVADTEEYDPEEILHDTSYAQRSLDVPDESHSPHQDIFDVAREKIFTIREMVPLLPVSSCVQLLLSVQWDVNEACVKVLEGDEQPMLADPSKSFDVVDGAQCMLPMCDEEGPVMTLYCGHSIHRVCLGAWVASALETYGPTVAVSCRCPDTSCRALVELDSMEFAAGADDPTSLSALSPPIASDANTSDVAKVRHRWRECLKSLLSSSSDCFPCPSSDCAAFLIGSPLQSEVQCVRGCGLSFCTQCHRRAHLPATCRDAERVREADVDGETSRLLMEGCRVCPRCRALTYRPFGCNHMSCSQCKMEYCWVCGKEWSLHSSNFYNCLLSEADGAGGLLTKFGDAHARHLMAISKVALQESSVRANLALRARLQTMRSTPLRFMDDALLLLERARTRVSGGWMLYGEYRSPTKDAKTSGAKPSAVAVATAGSSGGGRSGGVGRGGRGDPTPTLINETSMLMTLLKERCNILSNLCDRLNYHLNYLFSVAVGAEPAGNEEMIEVYGVSLQVGRWQRALAVVVTAVERQMETMRLGVVDLAAQRVL